MTWSYSGDPGNSDKDAVRFNTGLTDTNDQIIEDEEIEYVLDTHGVLAASIRIARRVAMVFGRKADQTIGDYSERFSQRAEAYRMLARELEEEKKTTGAGVIAGGISQSDKDAQEDDSDRVKPRFKRGQFDRQELRDN